MEPLILVKPTDAHLSQIEDFRREFMVSGDSMDGTSNLERFEDPKDWLAWIETLSDKSTCPSGFVCASEYMGVRPSDGVVVGMVNIRHELNDYLMHYGGHIGYCVRKSARRQGYAKELLRLAMAECRLLGLYRVLITCADTNLASRRVILSAGGVLENTELDPRDGEMTQRYWVQVCKPGLLVQLPGMGYTCAELLMLSCSDIFRARGYETVPMDFSSIPFRELKTPAEALELAKPLMLERLEGKKFDEYADVIFLSKSFGTICAGWLCQWLEIHPRQLYLTPVPEALPYIRPEERVLSMVLGSEDPFMTPDALREFCAERHYPSLIFDGVGHSLKYDGDTASTNKLNDKIYALCKK